MHYAYYMLCIIICVLYTVIIVMTCFCWTPFAGGMDSTRPILVLPAVGLKKLDSGAASMEEMIKTLLYFKHLLR